jgi:hypothetical protein
MTSAKEFLHNAFPFLPSSVNRAWKSLNLNEDALVHMYVGRYGWIKFERYFLLFETFVPNLVLKKIMQEKFFRTREQKIKISMNLTGCPTLVATSEISQTLL